MRKQHLVIAPTCLLALLTACVGGSGGSDGDGTITPSANIGSLVDSAVQGIHYKTATKEGDTNSAGQFEYLDGETITFSIGSLQLPAVAAGSVLTPLDLASAADITNQKATNISVLLQSLDDDHDPSNGINIPGTVAIHAVQVNFDQDPATFQSDSAVTTLMTDTGSILVDVTDARAHVTDSLSQINSSAGVVGTWHLTGSDGSYSHLVLSDDNTFSYAELDMTVENPDYENGVEAGTYSYDAATGKITFNLTYDDNTSDAQGGPSGLGSAGTPAVLDVDLLAGNTILQIANGALALNHVPAGATPLVGVWSLKSGAAFSVLTLFADNTFIYIENDLSVLHPEFENGLESGTYAYDSITGDITFTLSYDDNTSDGQGGASGIGSMNTPSVLSAALSNQDSTLTIAGGALVLNKEF